MAPMMAALCSSAVPWPRLFDLNFGRSERMMCDEEWPSTEKIVMPFGLSPHSGLPSTSLVVDELKVHVPTSCSLSGLGSLSALPGHVATVDAAITASARTASRGIVLLLWRRWVIQLTCGDRWRCFAQSGHRAWLAICRRGPAVRRSRP